MAVGIQMNQKELTKTCDFKLKRNLWSPWFMQKYFSVLRVKTKLAERIVFTGRKCNEMNRALGHLCAHIG